MLFVKRLVQGVLHKSLAMLVKSEDPFPIVVDGDSFRYNPDKMQVGRHYDFQFLGARWLAVKRQDEAVDFFYASP